MIAEVEELVVQIVKAKKAYYQEGKPIMSDYDYDRIENRVKELDPKHPILYAVGYDDSYDWWIDHCQTIIEQTHNALERGELD